MLGLVQFCEVGICGANSIPKNVMEVSEANSNPETYMQVPDDFGAEQEWRVGRRGYLLLAKTTGFHLRGRLITEGTVKNGSGGNIYVSGTIEIKDGVFDMKKAWGFWVGGRNGESLPAGRIVQTGGTASFDGVSSDSVRGLLFEVNGVTDLYELKGGNLNAKRLVFGEKFDRLIMSPGATLILDKEITSNPYPENLVGENMKFNFAYDAASDTTTVSVSPLDPEGIKAEELRKAEAIADRKRLHAQSPVCPVVLDPAKINILLAVESACSKSIGRMPSHGALKSKRFWLKDWTHPDESVSWRISNPKAAKYYVKLMLNSNKEGASLTIKGSRNEVRYTTSGKTWEHGLARGELDLPEGESVISINLEKEGNVTLKLAELIAVEAFPAVEKRIADFRAAGEKEHLRFCTSGYGIMVQGGGWAYPKNGDKKPWPGFAEDFDVNRFAGAVESMGGKFVIWSASWCRYLVPAPIKSIDEIAPGFTSRRDLLGELADELNRRGIQFFLYYHPGHNEPDWWKNNWDPERPGLFQENFMKVIREMGERYGNKVAGWFFDDDCLFCPSDYEALGAAARAGHPGRLVSYNPWIAPVFTPFQDIFFGEALDKELVKDGLFIDGPNRGLQSFHMRIYDGPDWGINRPNVKANPPEWGVQHTEEEVLACLKNQTPIAFNLLMWEDGSMPEQSVAQLQEVARRLGRVK
jgi:hypothetical protein